jgi:dienelactone hydrolase
MSVMMGVTGDQRTVYDDPSLGNGSVSSAVQAVVDWYGPMGLPDNPITHIATARTLPPFLIGQGSADLSVNPSDAQDLQAALIKAGATSTLTMIPGAGHEDHAFSATQLPATYAFLDRAFGR